MVINSMCVCLNVSQWLQESYPICYDSGVTVIFDKQ